MAYQALSPGELSKIPPSILSTLPALRPPAGVESNFANPQDRGYIQNSVMTVLFALMVCLFANRVYIKLFVVRKVGWDDLSCTIGFLGSVALYITNLWGTIRGPVGKHQWDVRLVDLLSDNFLITSALIVFLTPLSLLFTKLTFFLLYHQIFRPLRWLRISVYVGATLNCAFYGAAFIAQLIFETPRRHQTWLEHALSGEESKATALSVPLGAVGLGFDIALLVIPIAAIVGLQLPTKRKFGIMFIFMFGILACVGSILSIYYRVISNKSLDLTWNIMPTELVGVVELFIGVSCACMPAFSKTLHHHHSAMEKLRSILSSSFSSLRSTKSGSTIGRLRLSQRDNSSRSAMVKISQGPYSRHVAEVALPRGAALQPTYELGQLRTVQTFIGKGREGAASDDQIHLTHEIQQQQARTP